MYRHQNCIYNILFMTDAVDVYYGCQFYSSVTVAYTFGKSSTNQLIHTLLYCKIYRCIMIIKAEYIDTPKLCIVTSLVSTSLLLSKSSYYLAIYSVMFNQVYIPIAHVHAAHHLYAFLLLYIGKLVTDVKT